MTKKLGFGRESQAQSCSSWPGSGDPVWVFTNLRMRLWGLRIWVPVLTSLGVDAEGFAVF